MSSPLLLFGGYAVILFLAIYVFVYIPNKKKNKQMRELHASIAPGDKVITIGGAVGRVKERNEDYVTLIIDEEKGVTMDFLVMAVSQIKEKASSVPAAEKEAREKASEQEEEKNPETKKPEPWEEEKPGVEVKKAEPEEEKKPEAKPAADEK